MSSNGCIAALAAEVFAGDEVHDAFAVGRRDRRDLVALQADITRRRHLQTRRQVDPELQDLERAALALELLGRDLGVHEAATGRHPLDTALLDDALVPRAVAMRELAGQDERDGLETAMRMRAERQAAIARRIDLRAVVIQEYERVDLLDFLTRHGPACREIGDVVAHRGMRALDGLSGHGVHSVACQRGAGASIQGATCKEHAGCENSSGHPPRATARMPARTTLSGGAS